MILSFLILIACNDSENTSTASDPNDSSVDYENGWLNSYDYFNVHVFDYYNVLTDPNNHHRVEGNGVAHTVSSSPMDANHPNELYYYTGTNDHPSAEEHQKKYMPRSTPITISGRTTRSM